MHRVAFEIEWFEIPVGDWAGLAAVVFSIITALIAWGAFASLRKRERRQALTELHASLTSGDIAEARHTIGTLLYSMRTKEHPGRLESISAYFGLIWALQRSRNVLRTHLLPWKRMNAQMSVWQRIVRGRRIEDMTRALTWNLSEIADNIVRFRFAYGEAWDIEDDDAWADISDYVNADDIADRLKLLEGR